MELKPIFLRFIKSLRFSTREKFSPTSLNNGCSLNSDKTNALSDQSIVNFAFDIYFQREGQPTVRPAHRTPQVQQPRRVPYGGVLWKNHLISARISNPAGKNSNARNQKIPQICFLSLGLILIKSMKISFGELRSELYCGDLGGDIKIYDNRELSWLQTLLSRADYLRAVSSIIFSNLVAPLPDLRFILST